MRQSSVLLTPSTYALLVHQKPVELLTSTAFCYSCSVLSAANFAFPNKSSFFFKGQLRDKFRN